MMSRRKRRINRVNRASIAPVAVQQVMPIFEEAVPSVVPTLVRDAEQRIEMIPLNQISTEGYQRVLNMINVKKIARNFDIAKLGVLVVSKHADGTYAVLDGQHRLSAMRRIGKVAANCIVLEGLTVQQEADYFRRQNENKQALRITDTFNASIWAEDAESLRITELVGKYGFRFGKSGIPMCICAIAALQKTVQLFGFDTLENVLATVAATWPTDTTILRREMLAGLAEFWSRFADQITVQQFASRMAQKLPMDMYVDARNRSAGKANPGTAFNKGVRFVTCCVLVDNYNKGLRKDSKNRVTMEWDCKEGE